MSELTYFEKIRIQMEYAVPLIKDLKEVLGEETVLGALEEASKLRLERTQMQGKTDFSQMNEMVAVYAEGGALKYDVIASSADHFDVDIHACRYAEMMEQLGGRDFGHLLICGGDYIAAKQMGMDLSRTKTRMQGADFCDFRYRSAKPE
jgi:hypothetical protein